MRSSSLLCVNDYGLETRLMDRLVKVQSRHTWMLFSKTTLILFQSSLLLSYVPLAGVVLITALCCALLCFLYLASSRYPALFRDIQIWGMTLSLCLRELTSVTCYRLCLWHEGIEITSSAGFKDWTACFLCDVADDSPTFSHFSQVPYQRKLFWLEQADVQSWVVRSCTCSWFSSTCSAVYLNIADQQPIGYTFQWAPLPRLCWTIALVYYGACYRKLNQNWTEADM